ncbi:MAG: hypothetical protein KDA81_16165 [Planctomycetaceae bacterium]|nr:hypothetical protein [Planctomycetaceae bacterium]
MTLPWDLMRITVIAATLLLWGSGEQSMAQPSTASKINPRVFAPAAVNQQQRDVLAEYHASILDWGRIVSSRVEPVPNRSGQLFIGRPGHMENDVRPTAYAAIVLSFLAASRQPDSTLSDVERAAMSSQSIGLLRYLTASHVANGGSCANGKPWGNGWQSAMWARAVAMAAWQSWNSLDDDLREAVKKMIVAESDRFIAVQPKSSVRNDTGAEENAWNASITSLACNMLPDHEHSAAWETAAKRFMYNTFSVTADAEVETLGDDQQPIRSWVTTVNAHDDFTVENHGLVHVGYLKNSLTMLLENAVHWKMVDRQPPAACHHHVSEVFDLLCRCMNWNAAAIYFGGNDWQIYETQCSDILAYAAGRQLSGDRRAAYLEDTAMKHIRLRQQAEGGYYNGRRDLEYGGMCATRLIICYALHAVSDSLTPPASREEFDATANGITQLDSARAVLHRTPDKFASFTWAQKRMALAIPSSESSVVWPHFTSYTGVINAEHSSDKFCQLRNLSINTSEEDFAVSGTLVRCKGTLLHDFHYASPAGAFTVYAERLRPQDGFQWQYRKTGIVGLGYAVGQNKRKLHGEFGTLQTLGTDSPQQTTPLHSRWLNIDNRIGYVVCRSDGKDNIMLHHDRNRIDPRRPHLQESIALISDDAKSLTNVSHWACVVTFLNQTAEETQSLAGRVHLSGEGNSATVNVDGESFQISFEDDLSSACREFLQPNSQPQDDIVKTIESYSGDIAPIVEQLALSVAKDHDDVAGILANQSFSHPVLRQTYPDDLLHFFVPDSYVPETPFGLMIFMHGGGPTTPRDHPLHVVTHPDGDPASIGLQPFMANLPFILVAPSAPWNESTGGRWNVPEADAYIRAVIDECSHRFNIDRDRIVLGGYSMGGFGAYHLCQRLNDQLAGGFIFSGSWKTMHWKAWTGLPLFLRHGVHDASPPDQNGQGGRPRFTDVFYSRTTANRLKDFGMAATYVEDDGNHAIRPATDAMKQLAEWTQALRRQRYPRHVVALSPRGWRATSDTPTPHSHWVTIHKIGDGTIEFDQIVREGPAPAFRETAEAFHKQSLHLTTIPINAGLVEAGIQDGNRIEIQTQNVRSFSIWLHPNMVNFDVPLIVRVDGVESTYPIKAKLIDALRSYQRFNDWTHLYHAELIFDVDDDVGRLCK